MSRTLFFILMLGIARLGHSIPSIVDFSNLEDYVNYESSLPCEIKSGKTCHAIYGIMGLALDTASQAGLEITTIVIEEKNFEAANVYVKTKKYGTCLVEIQNIEQLGPIGFLCSLKKTEHVFTLTKDNEKFSLLDITQSKSIHGNL